MIRFRLESSLRWLGAESTGAGVGGGRQVRNPEGARGVGGLLGPGRNCGGRAGVGSRACLEGQPKGFPDRFKARRPLTHPPGVAAGAQVRQGGDRTIPPTE